MSVELTMLAFTVGLGVLQLLAAAQASTMQRGMKWNVSPRDHGAPQLTGIAGRIDRSFKNLMETFPFFVAAVLIVHMSSANSSMSAMGAQVYFVARLVYFPVYTLGIPVLRSLIWLASLVGLLMVLAAAFLTV